MCSGRLAGRLSSSRWSGWGPAVRLFLVVVRWNGFRVGKEARSEELPPLVGEGDKWPDSGLRSARLNSSQMGLGCGSRGENRWLSQVLVSPLGKSLSASPGQRRGSPCGEDGESGKKSRLFFGGRKKNGTCSGCSLQPAPFRQCNTRQHMQARPDPGSFRRAGSCEYTT